MNAQYTDQEEDPLDIYDIHFFYDNNLGPGEFHYQYGIFCGDLSKVWLTSDGGDTWTTLATVPGGSFLCPDSHYVEFWQMSFVDPDDPASSGLVCSGHDMNIGYLFRTSDGGANWTQTYCYDVLDPDHMPPDGCGIATMYDVEAIGSSNPVALTVGYGQQVIVSKTSGTPNYDPCTCSTGNPCSSPTEVWKQYGADASAWDPLGSDPAFFGSARIDNTHLYLVGAFGRILYFNYNSGTPTFTDRASIYFNRLRDGAFVDHTTGFVVGQGLTLWMTGDSGQNWTSAWTWSLSEDNDYLSAIDLASSGQYGAAVGDGGFIAKGVLNGSTWTWSQVTGGSLPSSHFGKYLKAVEFVSGTSTAYAVGIGGAVIKSTNNGASWAFVGNPEDESPDRTRR